MSLLERLEKIIYDMILPYVDYVGYEWLWKLTIYIYFQIKNELNLTGTSLLFLFIRRELYEYFPYAIFTFCHYAGTSERANFLLKKIEKYEEKIFFLLSVILYQ